MLKLDLLASLQKYFKSKKLKVIIPKTAVQNNDSIPPSFWYELKHLISVTPDDFEALYVKPLKAFCEHLKKSKSVNNKSALIKSVLTLIIAVSKIRRAHMLPIGTDAETCYQQQDAWTYALFTAVLFRKFIQVDQDILQQVAQWLPANGISWLKQYSLLFSEWQESLRGNTANNSLSNVIYQAEDTLLNNPALPTHRHDQHNEINQPSCITDQPANNETTQAAESECAQDNLQQDNENANGVPPASTEVDNTQTDSAQPNGIKTHSYHSVKAVSVASESPSTLGETFINWLIRAIARRQLAVNTPEALIQRVEQGALLKMPDIYHTFVTANKSVKAFMRDKSEAEGLDLLTQGNRFIPTAAHTGFLHAYYWNNWADRQIINGLLIVPDALFTPDVLPPCNEQLHPESLVTS